VPSSRRLEQQVRLYKVAVLAFTLTITNLLLSPTQWRTQGRGGKVAPSGTFGGADL